MQTIRPFLIASLVLAVSLVTIRPASAQQTRNEGVGVGVEGMMALPSLTGDVKNLYDTKTGYGFGLWVGGNKNGVLGFAGEFIWLRKQLTSGGNTITREALEIPAVFHLNFGTSNRKAFGYGIVGPVFTINVRERLTGGLTGDNFAGSNIGVMAGVGVEVLRIGVGGRGNWGLRDISKDGLAIDGKEFTAEIVGKIRFN